LLRACRTLRSVTASLASLALAPYAFSMSSTKSTGYESITSVDAVLSGLETVGYIPTRQIATAIFLAHGLRKPVLIEGPAGVGKTDLAQSLARWLSLPLVRLQCYDGLDEGKALYEWKYGKQLLYTQVLKEKLNQIIETSGTLDSSLKQLASFDDVFFSEQFLEARPLLTAMQQKTGSVLLIDEVDKADEAFEAFLLEALSDYQVTVPEIGTLTAPVPPIVILTSNNIRELGDALKRRCLHLHLDFPEAAREQRIVAARVPGVSNALLGRLVAFVQSIRGSDLRKRPSIAESVDWAKTLLLLNANSLSEDFVRDTLNVLLKHESDIALIQKELNKHLSAGFETEGRPRGRAGYPDMN
jgi:MoxR-like ATPase